MNKVILSGHLGQDPDTRYSRDGKAVTRISLASRERWKDNTGEPHEHTDWHRVVFFGKLAEIAGEFLAKGKHILIAGKIRYSKYTGKDDGIERWATDIIADHMEMLDKKADADGHGTPSSGPSAAAYRAARDGQRAPAQANDFQDDDIPF